MHGSPWLSGGLTQRANLHNVRKENWIIPYKKWSSTPTGNVSLWFWCLRFQSSLVLRCQTFLPPGVKPAGEGGSSFISSCMPNICFLLWQFLLCFFFRMLHPLFLGLWFVWQAYSCTVKWKPVGLAQLKRARFCASYLRTSTVSKQTQLFRWNWCVSHLFF